MSLPDAWVDRIFTKMALTYGTAWLRMWDGLDIAAVKSNWAHELAGYQQNPRAIGHALDHLPPDKPPTVLQFRDMCHRSPVEALPALPGPKADPERVQRALEEAASRVRARTSGPRAWAHRLKAREECGERLTITQKQMWREALQGHES